MGRKENEFDVAAEEASRPVDGTSAAALAGPLLPALRGLVQAMRAAIDADDSRSARVALAAMDQLLRELAGPT